MKEKPSIALVLGGKSPKGKAEAKATAEPSGGLVQEFYEAAKAGNWAAAEDALDAFVASRTAPAPDDEVA